MLNSKGSAVLIAEIHDTFNTAGDKLLANATKILQMEKSPYEKVERLKIAGFVSSIEVQKWNTLSVTKKLADLIQYYQAKYPNNKFITEEQVRLICDKYKLVCAPIERYKGFVPEIKLRDIESFKFDTRDNAVLMIKIIGAWGTGIGVDFGIRRLGGKHIHKKLGLKLIPENHPSLYCHGNSLFAIREGGDNVGGGYVDKIQIFGDRQMQICAPSKDMKLTGLSKIGAIFSSVSTVTVPDPVVLQPCAGGYLIVTAWGDEASDENVVNQKMN